MKALQSDAKEVGAFLTLRGDVHERKLVISRVKPSRVGVEINILHGKKRTFEFFLGDIVDEIRLANEKLILYSRELSVEECAKELHYPMDGSPEKNSDVAMWEASWMDKDLVIFDGFIVRYKDQYGFGFSLNKAYSTAFRGHRYNNKS